MISKIRKTISIYKMLSKGDRVLVALSGGPDSVCLLYILKELGLKLYIAHLNHGLRGRESNRDQRFCEELGRRLEIPVYTKKIKIKKNEESCRNARYMFLEETAHAIGATKIALGHNADDQAETVLMRLLRGAGVKGLSGIPPVRGIIIRPLINVWRTEILDYLKKRNISYRIDNTNLKTDFFRNRIRHELIPYLSRYNPNIKNILQNTGRNMAMMNESRTFQRAIKSSQKGLFSSAFPQLAVGFPEKVRDEYLEQEVIKKTAQRLGLNLSADHISDIMALAGEKAGSKSLCLPKGVKVTREYDRLFFSRESYELQIPGQVRIPEHNILITSMLCKKTKKIPRKPFEVMLDFDKILHPLIIRNRRPGDVFQPIGFSGRKKIKDIFIDEKIPERMRDRIPLVISGKDICWIPGYRIGEKYKVDSSTKRVVKLWLS